MKKNLEFRKILFLFFLLFNSFFVHAETLEIEKLNSQEVLQIGGLDQFSDEEFDSNSESEGKIKNKELIYWIVLSGLILIFIVVLVYIISIWIYSFR